MFFWLYDFMSTQVNIMQRFQACIYVYGCVVCILAVIVSILDVFLVEVFKPYE